MSRGSRGPLPGGLALLLTSVLGCGPDPGPLEVVPHLDLAKVEVLRITGGGGSGEKGVPVAGGHDLDGDGWPDLALSSIQASPQGRQGAGMVYLIFGDGALSGELHAADDGPRVLPIHGAAAGEVAGGELWMGDVTGDGLAELLIGRQNHSPDAQRLGAGALTILIGGSALRERAATGPALDLAEVDAGRDPLSSSVTTLRGTTSLGRLGIWMRSGDQDGDGIDDVLIGADQEGEPQHSGVAYLVRGGAALASAGTVDISSPSLADDVLKIVPSAPGVEFHFGATCQLQDLDGDGRGELLIASTLERAGAGIPLSASSADLTHSRGGTERGSFHVIWSRDIPTDGWRGLGQLSATTRIDGGPLNSAFGEELFAGDFDGDGETDLLVGDLIGSGGGGLVRGRAGSGHIIFSAKDLVPGRLSNQARVTHLLGAASGDIAGDTATAGDFDADGTLDLMVGSPHASLFGRTLAGTVTIFWGDSPGWSETVDLARPPEPEGPDQLTLLGARGTIGSDRGDVLGYSATAGDMNRDGVDDLILNEMLGNAPGAIDVGTLIVVDGRHLAGARTPP